MYFKACHQNSQGKRSHIIIDLISKKEYNEYSLGENYEQ